MKKQLFILLSAVLLLFSSCEKVINVDLNSAAPQYVIEADLYEGTHPFRVHIAKTTDFYGKNPQAVVEDALVILKDGSGSDINIPYTSNGWYELSSFTALAGKTYQLSVKSGGKEFSASSTVPGTVTVDSISYEYKENEGFGDDGYEVTAYFNDPAGVKNYYRLMLTVNDTFQNKPEDMFLDNDKFNDGRLVKETYFKRFDHGDSLQIELRTMDEKVYDFYSSLNDILNNQNGPAPANPNSNIKGGALGYFGAFSSSRLGIKLP